MDTDLASFEDDMGKILRKLAVGLLIFWTVHGPATAIGLEPCQGSGNPFARVIAFDRNPAGQLIALHDCNRDGHPDVRTAWSVVHYERRPHACPDPYDPRHLLVPVNGSYRVWSLPSSVETLVPEVERENFQPGKLWERE